MERNRVHNRQSKALATGSNKLNEMLQRLEEAEDRQHKDLPEDPSLSQHPFHPHTPTPPITKHYHGEEQEEGKTSELLSTYLKDSYLWRE